MSSSTLWYLECAPQSLAEFAGNEEAVESVKKWALDWSRGKAGKPLLVSGASGVGKTALVKALASEFGWELIAFESSSAKKEDFLRLQVSGASGNLFGSLRLFLFDDVDAIFSKTQVNYLVPFLKESRNPVILVAEDVWAQNLAAVRFLCTQVELKRVNWRSVKKVLEKTGVKKGVSVDADTIARSSKGDLRSAFIDFQSSANGELFLDSRDRLENVFETVRHVFKTKSFAHALDASNSSEIDLDLLVKWLEENVPAEYDVVDDQARAFNALSRSDVFSGRIRKRQDYGLLKYVRALAIGGVACAKQNEYKKFTPYRFPSIVKKLGESKADRALIKAGLSKISVKLHCSRTQAREAVRFLGVSGYYELSEEEAKAVK